MNHSLSPDTGNARRAALLQWWMDAGVDTLVADTPASWKGGKQRPQGQKPTRQATAQTPEAQPRSATAPPSSALNEPAATDAPAFAACTSVGELKALVAASLPNAPFADGRPGAPLMVIGEGPSATDLETGRPFTGPAGLLLDKMLAAIGLSREACYITLLAPRRQIPGPVPRDAIRADLALTRTHVRLAAPKFLLMLGGPAAQTLAGTGRPISELRGQWLTLADPEAKDIRALATFNPAYLLRRPIAKREAWRDLLTLKGALRS